MGLAASAQEAAEGLAALTEGVKRYADALRSARAAGRAPVSDEALADAIRRGQAPEVADALREHLPQ